MKKILIDLEDVYCEGIQKERVLDTSLQHILMAIKHGTVLPENHGRLIDADSLFSWFDGESRAKYPIKDGKQYDTMMFYEIFDEIDDAPTIIEGTEGKE